MTSIRFAFPLMLLLTGCYATAPAAPPKAEAVVIPELPDSELRDLTAAEKKLLADGFAKGLKDPLSAQFQWTKVPKKFASEMIDYCGMVNAKNSYGGYVGAMPFMGSIMTSKGKIVGGRFGVSETPESQKYEIVSKMCRDKGLNPFKAA